MESETSIKLTKKGSRPSARSRVNASSKASPLMLNSLSDSMYRIRTNPISPAFSTLECAYRIYNNSHIKNK